MGAAQRLGVSPASGAQPIPVSQASQPANALALTMRRSPGTVELVIQGTGPGPVLQQGSAGGAWIGQLRIASPSELRFGPQRIALPEAGLQSIGLSGSGSDYQLQVVPMPGVPLPRPVVSADGKNLVISFAGAPQFSQQASRLDLRQPAFVPQPNYAPPLLQRAVAPPLGDMAVGTMFVKNPGTVTIKGPPVWMTVRDANPRDVLETLARQAGYGFVWMENTDQGTRTFSSSSSESSDPNAGVDRTDKGLSVSTTREPTRATPVSISFQGVPYGIAINSVLMSGNVQGRFSDGILYAGFGAAYKTFGSQVSKVYRLNQASAESAARYLANLGATMTTTTVVTNTVTQGVSQSQQVQGAGTTNQTQEQRTPVTETFGGGIGPLRGLIGTTDSRLQSVTLIGSSEAVAIAEAYLKQIDLRQRQVALSVKILDVTLDNDAAVSNSFAFRYGNNFIVSDRGQLIGAFGNLLPPNDSNFDVMSGGASSAKSIYVDPDKPQIVQDPLSPAPINPGSVYDPNVFYNYVKGVILSASTKTLASPTLFLNDNPEGSAADSGDEKIGRKYANEAYISVGANEITSYTVNQGSNGAPNTCQPKFETAGLTLGARVKRIDDNGFVTFNLSPSITALTGSAIKIEGCGTVRILAVRKLDSGDVRVRSGQTLILAGVISDQDIQAVRKWPILGDIPFVGQFFRDSQNGRKKRELVIMVTPRIVDDFNGGVWGYGYTPETRDAKRLLGGAP